MAEMKFWALKFFFTALVSFIAGALPPLLILRRYRALMIEIVQETAGRKGVVSFWTIQRAARLVARR